MVLSGIDHVTAVIASMRLDRLYQGLLRLDWVQGPLILNPTKIVESFWF